jgi:zinc transport system substrate-binding protein
MKRLYLVLLVLMAVILISCKGKNEAADQQKIKIAVTILPYSGIVKEIGGDKVDITVLVPPNSACETYEPTPVDIAKAAQSEIYFFVGANYAFEKNLVKSITENYKNVAVVDCSTGLEVKENNPHLWLYPAGLKKIAENVFNSLKKAKPLLEEYFAKNKERYLKQIDSADAVIKGNMASIKEKKILVFHPSWLYYAGYYNLEQIAIENEGKEPTAQDLKNVIDLAKKYKITTLFLEPNTAPESAQAIKEELKAVSVLLNPMEGDILKNLIYVSEKISGSLK